MHPFPSSCFARRPPVRLWLSAAVLTAVAGLGGCGGGDDPAVPPSIGGEVRGLGPGKAVVVANIAADGRVLGSASVEANGRFELEVPAATAYDVRVLVQPAGQRCAASNATGIAGLNAGPVGIDCTDSAPSQLQPQPEPQAPVPAPAPAPAPEPTPEPQLPAIPSAPSGLTVTIGLKALSFSWSAAAGATSYQLMEDRDGEAGPLSYVGDRRLHHGYRIRPPGCGAHPPQRALCPARLQRRRLQRR